MVIKPRVFSLAQICLTALLGLSFTSQSILAGEYPALAPLPAKKTPAASKVEMGKRLFFDARISGDGAISCATCHDPNMGFGDGRVLSEAYPGTDYFRNSPSLINTQYKADFTDTGWGWEGRLGSSLNDVVRDQLTETTIMNMDMRIMHERAKQDPVYVEMCEANFGGECSSGKMRKALVAFIETLVSNKTPFDSGTMSRAAKSGQKLFEGKAGCIQCHNGPYLSDGKPHNTGVPENLDIFKDPVRHLTYRSVLHTYGVPNMAAWRRDVGYFMVSRDYKDVGKFVTPTLRELKYTAPYMHNGTLASLEEVIDYYNEGGGHDDVMPNELAPLGLSQRDKKNLLAFLEALSADVPLAMEKMEIPQDYDPTPDWLETKN
ncbi:MAG: photosynthetic protein synthase I [Gammaproteobacteria bacterium]|nr:photosynthetic protein synthase I [Gammaproteobacteria bacterium]